MKLRLTLLLLFCSVALAGQGTDVAQPDTLQPTVADTLMPLAADTLAADTLAADTLAADTVASALKRKGFFARLIETFDATDPAYIEPNYFNYAAMLQNTNFYQSYNLRAQNDNGDVQRISLSPAATFRVGPYFGWRWLFLGYTFDVSRPQRAGQAVQFNVSLYSARLGVDMVYVKNKSNFSITSVRGFEGVHSWQVKDADVSGMSTYNLSLNLYYVFNHRRFSYPAAYSQSTVQRRSAGSFLLGLRYDQTRCAFDYTTLPDLLTEDDRLFEGFKGISFDNRNYSVSFGYAYNWVPLRNVLVSASVMPSLGYRLQKGERFELDRHRVWTNVKNLNIDFVNRAAVVWNTGRLFAGASVVNYLYNYRSGKFGVTNALTYFNVYVGVNFQRRKEYRTPGKSKW
ncbi:MAG: DUF4421 domain-containing protein [Bacteroidaceae bacterium]|nr:DUF4421 domain-containing protein [Bacteroidaceae bacterium]